ncbi:hypothetical protein HYPSUDRAFT_44000 [Hypholoma sublateritium FD-334 SS-4]|uniref:BTB domain-containing protein n=1 Tax=Hypholoma sublateritium (strain FD-334 SS-4) TaxID=945553 RepID=A0A0D2NT22_HYPSF|nr:hypothetical protein HYPSUDRAFT_44000 [Hypholoma sublateritium FD-334 SS-4]
MDKERESSPSTNRKRDALENESMTVARRSEKFWFDDGSVVLQVESVQYRVHRSILASYSPVFNDLFRVPQPEGDRSGWVDGCPTVCMAGDTTRDWESVLGFIYKPSSLALKWPDVGRLAGMMRLGKKYQIDDIFAEALARLRAQFPRTLAARDAMTAGGNMELCEWISKYFQVITRLGEEMGLWSILPVAYYMAASYEENIPSFILYYRNLSPNSMRSVAHGTAAIWDDVVSRSFRWTKPTELTIPTISCASKPKCTAARTLALAEVCAKVGKQDAGIALDVWKRGAGCEFCAECLRAAQTACEGGRAYIWDHLARYFLGDNWEKLEDTKSDVLPAIWRPR